MSESVSIRPTHEPNAMSQNSIDGWMLLVGIFGGTTVLVTILWKLAKNWYQHIEREAIHPPPIITYITDSQILSNQPTGNRLAEIPVSRIFDLSIERNVSTLCKMSWLTFCDSDDEA